MITLPSGEVLVDVERSGVVESVHRGHVVLLDPTGAVRLSIGDVTAPIFPRSSLKPVQAVGMKRADLPFARAELALASASHDGEPEHVAAVGKILADGGLDESDLRCPPALPINAEAARAVLAAGGGPTRLQMNCSGKHAAMLRTCLVNDWPLSSYLTADHPLQQRLRDTVQLLCAESVATVGVDGCGAPLFAVSLTALARAFGRIATATAGPEHEMAEAMRQFPQLIGGNQQTTSRLMAGLPGSLIKGGAEGVYAAALPDGSSLAVKIDDGQSRAADRVAVAGLRALGASGAILDELAAQPVLGGGRPVGQIRMRPGVLG